MKKLLLSSFAITALALSGCAAVESNRTIDTKAVQADYSVPYEQRKKVVVSNFNNASDYQRGVFSSDKDRLGSQAQDILSSQLQMTNFFRVVNRTDTQAMKQEAAISGTVQKLTGADLVISGSVLEFGRKVTGDKQLFGVLGRGKQQTAYAKVSLQVTNVKTSEVMMTVQGAGEYELSNREVLGTGSTAGYDATLNGKVLNLAITAAVEKLVNHMSRTAL